MPEHKIRSTVYIDQALRDALRVKASVSHRSMSAIVNDAIRAALREDQRDIAAFAEREDEKAIGFDALLAEVWDNPEDAQYDALDRAAQADRAMQVIRELQQNVSTGGRKFTRDEMNER
jgi:hypothetical protein